MTVLAGEAVKKRNELSDGDLVEKCMNTLRKIFTGEVNDYSFCLGWYIPISQSIGSEVIGKIKGEQHLRL